MLLGVVCICEENFLINTSRACVLLLLPVGSLPLRLLNALSPVGLAESSCTTTAEGAWSPTYVLTCSRPHTLRIFSEIGFRTWSPLAPRPTPYH
ncbi:hypothetical protein AVEN_202097-1 [Araneus ventricosus]|uniref:Uncharacterized protein n=1 Tax=Araneus ventricosus TaxID=182803 RepID=A0A4Y2PPG4_ARAVE|nr:hypothetical protein AVEN_202097-1 [Araneus ventricosus]